MKFRQDLPFQNMVQLNILIAMFYHVQVVNGWLEHISTPSQFSLLVNHFYKREMQTKYQCMELCVQFSKCKSLSFHRHGTCYLHDRPRKDLWSMFTYNGFQEFLDKTELPKHIAGICDDHECDIDARCVSAQGTNLRTCVPHGIPTFTCQLHWMRYNNTCYRPFVIRKSWKEAQVACSKENATLAEIQSEDVWKYVKRILAMYSMPKHHFKAALSPGSQMYWVALTDQEQEGRWVWNGTNTILTDKSYTNWAAVSANSVAVNCVGLSNATKFLWTATDCNDKLFYVCEMRMWP